MKRFILYMITVIIFSSCIEKQYTYEMIDDNADNELVRKVFYQPNDSLAYIHAFVLFHEYRLKESIYNIQEEAQEFPLPVAIGFNLLDDENKNITNIAFSSKKNQEDSIRNTYDELIKKGKLEYLKSLPRIDTLAVQKLKPYFIVKKDEFSQDGTTWHTPKNAPNYVNYNAFYPYFMSSGKYNLASNLRIRFQYAADGWLFIEKLQFSIDGSAYEYSLLNVKRDNNSTIWEWSDDSVDNNIYDILEKIASSKETKMKIIGSDYHKIKTISNQQKVDIKRTLEYYEAMSGEKPRY